MMTTIFGGVRAAAGDRGGWITVNVLKLKRSATTARSRFMAKPALLT
jgi:hypothetical protein